MIDRRLDTDASRGPIELGWSAPSPAGALLKAERTAEWLAFCAHRTGLDPAQT